MLHSTQPGATTPAKLVCVSLAQINHCFACASLPAFYRIVWEIPATMQCDVLALRRLQGNYLFGKVICAN